jgi:hypothetical protein
MKILPHVVLISFMRSKRKGYDLLYQWHVCTEGYFGLKDIHICMSLV